MTFNLDIFIARIRLLFTDPKGCWQVVAAEDTSYRNILEKLWGPVLAALAAATLLGTLVRTWSPFLSLGTAALTIGVGLAVPVANAYFAQILANRFGGNLGLSRGFSFMAHALTPTYVGLVIAALLPGEMGSLPALCLLTYSLVLFYLGVPIMAGIAEDKHIPFTVSLIAIGILVYYTLNQIFAVYLVKPFVG